MILLAEAISERLRWHALPPLWLIVLVLIPAVALLVRWLYQREAGRVGPRLRLVMGALRVLAVLLVLGAFFGPYSETIEGERVKRHLVLCIDTSQSMEIPEGYESQPELAERLRAAAGYDTVGRLAGTPRLELVKDILGSDRAYLERLADNFRIHIYRFDDGLQAPLLEPRVDETSAETAERMLAQLGTLSPDGQYTRIGTAIQELSRAFAARNEPIAGILLFTDGQQTTGAPTPVEAARNTGPDIKVFPVAVGDPAAAINIGVSRIDAPEVALAGDEVFFTVTVHARGIRPGTQARIEVKRLDTDEPFPVDTRYFDLPADDETHKETFRHRFNEPGRYDLQIGIPPQAGEAVEGDNFQQHSIRIVRLRMKVLFVASEPNYTYRFLGEILRRAEGTVECQTLLLSAERDWPQEASRGLDPLQQFPRTARELAEYDVIHLMDVDPRDPRVSGAGDAYHFSKLLEEWVAKRGGGLILHAGRLGNVPQKYDTPELQALLPVVPYSEMLDNRLREILQPDDAKLYRVTPAGADHPIMRVLQDPDRVRTFWEGEEFREGTHYLWYCPVQRAKSSATVLAERKDIELRLDQDPHPLIAVQDYGLGTVLWVGTDELWRMRFAVENLYYWRFWSGAIRHLATYRLLSGNKRIKIWVDRGDGRYQVGNSVKIEAKYLDENFLPLDAAVPGNETQTLTLRGPEGLERKFELTSIESGTPEGLYGTIISPSTPGSYTLAAEPTGPDDEIAEARFVVEKTAIEQRNPLLDLETLNQVARASGGDVLQPDEFLELLKNPDIPSTSIVRSGEPKRDDLWDDYRLLLLVVSVLTAEWILRRKNLLL